MLSRLWIEDISEMINQLIKEKYIDCVATYWEKVVSFDKSEWIIWFKIKHVVLFNQIILIDLEIDED